MEEILYKVGNLHQFHEASECAFVTQLGNVTYSGSVKNSLQRVELDMSLKNQAIFEKHLIQKAKCVTLTYQGSNMEGLKGILNLSRYIRNHINVYVGNERIADDILMSIVRPLVWITENEVRSL